MWIFKQPPRVLLIGFGTVCAVVVFAATAIHALWYAPEQEMPAPPPSLVGTSRTSSPFAGEPVRLIIPALSIDANVQQVGLNTKGAMGVPSNFIDVAWYKYGALPGALGSAVLDGHVDNGLSLAGVFKHLNELKVGDEVLVRVKGGTTLRFVVSEIESYPYHSVPSDRIFSLHDVPRLNLITCEGGWVAGERTYDHRLVVYTTLESSP